MTTDERTTVTTEEQVTVTDGRTATLTETQATTSDGRTTLTEAERIAQFRLHKTMYRAGRDGRILDGRTLSTDGQLLVSEEQTMETMVEQTTGMDGQTMMLTATMEEEQVMAAEVDPLALSPSATGAASSDTMVGHCSMEDTLLASPEKEVQNVDDGCDTNSAESLVGVGKKVAGRERAVVVDEDSDTMSIGSISSADEEYSMATSSSRPGQGVKRRRRKPVEGKGKARRESGEEKKGKKKGRKGVVGNKDTPEKEESVGKHGEPKGIFDHDLEDMSSEVLGGAIQNWADSIEDIRSKSKNIQGRLSGVMKRSVTKIKDGTALLVVRSMASGDPEFLRMRNTELEARLQEAKREIVRLQERLKRSPELPSPPRKRLKERAIMADMADVASADLADSVDPPSPEEAFPPLPQRAPRVGVARDGSVKKKMGPRIVSDIQVAPPYKERRREEVTIPAVPVSEAEWSVAVGSRRRGKVKGDKPPLPPPPVPYEGRPPPMRRQQQPKVRLPRPPLSSAVTISGRSEGFSYAEAMKSARERIDLESLGIRTTRVRKALNGGMIVEISGEDSRSKAEDLVVKLRDVFGESAAISCPVKKRELTVTGFDESVTVEEVAEALSKTGGCPIADIKMGPIRIRNNGLGMIWAQLPVAAAAKTVEEGRIRLGWTMARVELLKVRPLQCYKCWSFGHVQTTCRSIVDRRGACFRCGQKGHLAGVCANSVHCAVCHDAGVEASHRLGGPQCAAQSRQDVK